MTIDLTKTVELILSLYGFLAAIVKFCPTLNEGWLLTIIKFIGKISNRQTDDAAIRTAKGT